MICVGNAKVDIFLQIHDSNEHFRLDKETGELCIKSGDKATVDSAAFLIGGNAANVAIGCSRLGFKTAIIAEIGSDEFSGKILNTLKSENVSEAFIKRDDKASSFSVIINYLKERTIFEEHVDREHNFSFVNLKCSWVYLTSMGNKWEEAYGKTLAFALDSGAKIAFNPGTRQYEKGAESFSDILKNTEILFVNREEGLEISKLDIKDFEENYNEKIKQVLEEIKKTGPKIVVLTDGTRGAFMIDSEGNISTQPSGNAEVVERTGAGDAFASGFLSAVLSGKSHDDAMRWGARNASSVIGKVGATEGLLRKEEIEND